MRRPQARPDSADVSSAGTHSALLARTLTLRKRAAHLNRYALNAGASPQLRAVQRALLNIETWLSATDIASDSPVLRAVEARLRTEAHLLEAIQRVNALDARV